MHFFGKMTPYEKAGIAAENEFLQEFDRAYG